MTRMAIAVLAGLFLFGYYSSVYACDRAKKAEVVRHALETTTAPAVMVKVRVPMESTQRVVCIMAREEHMSRTHAVVRTAKMARTLGRAFVTTVGAVMGTLVQAAVDRTAAVV